MKPHTNVLRSLCVVLLFNCFSILKAGWNANNPFEQKVFIENKGQFDDKDDLPGSNIRYVIENGARMFFTPAGVTYQMAILEDKEDLEGKKQEERMKVDYSYIHMMWVGSNPLVQIIAEDKVSDYYTYPSRTKRNATITADAFKKITYKNLYPNIDVVYEFHPKEGIKYTVILHPGANPADIQMKYVSTKKVFADEQGNIHLKSIKGDVIDHAPVTFYEDNKQAITSSFSLSKSNVVTFNLDNYDNSKTVVIDPWTTNPGFIGLNRAYNICKDAAGNLYSTGGVNPFYLKKFNPGGTTLLWTFTLPNGQNWSIDNVVDPATGDSYICYGAWSGNIDSKINTAGTIVFNNTAAQNGSGNTFGEAYELALNCKTGILYGAGFFSGPNTSVWQMNKATGMQSAWVNANPALTIEVRSMETDFNGDVYLMSVPLGSAQAGNKLIRMTSALVPIWNVNDGYNLTEAQPGFYQGYCCNGINSIAVGCFVYTHDGLTIKKWDKSNGALLGSTNIPGGSVYMCSGMFLDVCGNLYAGSMTGVYKYDLNLVQLSFSSTGGAVYDIIDGNIPGEVIAAGNGFIQSLNMNTCSNLTITTTYTPPTCGLCDAKATATSNACAVTYSWSNGATTNSITNLCGGTYTVSLVNGCSATNVFTTVVIPASGNAFTINSTVINADCNSATGTVNINSITGSAPTFTLSEGTNTITSSMTPPYSITGVSVGTHTYTVFNSMGCSVTFTAQILNVGVPPNLTATTPVTLGCVPNSVTLNAASTTTGVTWSWAGTGIVSGGTTTSPVVNQTGNFTVTVTQGLCTNTMIVTVNPNTTPPNISIAPPASLTCAQGSITLVGSSTTTGALFKWTSGPATASYVVNAAGIYTLTVTDAVNGCTSVATTTVVFVNTLNALATGTNVKCFGGNTGSATVSITGGSGNYTYFWTNNSSISSNPQGLTAGIYTVTTMDGFCSVTTTVLISQPPALSLAINSNTTNACANTVINMNSFASGGVGPYTYTWSPGPNSSAYNVSEINPGNYTYGLNITDANGCLVGSSINLTFNQIPIITVTSGTVCYGDKAVLNASGAETYQWNPINYSGGTYTTTGSSNLYMTIVGTNTSTGCNSLPVTSTLIVNPLPVPAIAATNNTGCVPVCVTFTANNSGGAVQNCSWDFGDGSFASNVLNTDRCFTMAGDYTVTATVTDANGCVAKITTTVQAYPIPVADFNWSPIKPIVNHEEVTFTDASFNAVIKKWDWYFADLPKPHSYVQNPNYQYMEAGTYPVALLVTSDHGCVDTIMKVIIVGEDYGIYVPNIFSPNGDGLNDVFQPKGFGITKYELRIFNRWGEELMFTNDFYHGWDGMWKGKLSQEDTYIWKINLTNVFGKSHELSGHVTLIK